MNYEFIVGFTLKLVDFLRCLSNVLFNLLEFHNSPHLNESYSSEQYYKNDIALMSSGKEANLFFKISVRLWRCGLYGNILECNMADSEYISSTLCCCGGWLRCMSRRSYRIFYFILLSSETVFAPFAIDLGKKEALGKHWRRSYMGLFLCCLPL